MNSNLCPCGTQKSYIDCCGIAHSNIKLVKTPEALMRSRYTAFTKGNIDYLLQSWSSKTRDNSKRFKKELLEWTKSVIWLKLEVLNTSIKTSNNTGTVLFKAHYFENGKPEYIEENSFFEKENNHWVYVKAN